MTYYEILGITTTADDAEVKRAFRKMAMLHHPDTNPDPEAHHKFQLVYIAYEVLSDPLKRSLYDRMQASPQLPLSSAAHRDKAYRPRYRAPQPVVHHPPVPENFITKMRNRILAVLLCFLLLVLGMTCGTVGINYLASMGFNGSLFLGVVCSCIGGICLHVGGKSFLHFLNHWQRQ